MKLVSGIHDYYDALFVHAVKERRVFNRNQKDLYLSFSDCNSHFHPDFSCKYRGTEFSFSFFIIGFCGKLYPGVSVSYRLSYDDPTYYTRKSEKFYNYDELITKYPQIGSGEAKIDLRYGRNVHAKSITLEGIKAWLTGMSKHQSIYHYDFFRLTEIFIKNKVAYFRMEEDWDQFSMQEYPVLKDYGFGKVFDVNQCFQTIEYFMNNELMPPDSPYVMPVPDKIKAQSKGFNEQSFRKAKSVK